MSKANSNKPSGAAPMSNASAPLNPLLGKWTAAFEMPPFGDVAIEHFQPAFDQAMKAHGAEIDTIAGQTAAPTFANTIEALEKSGELLGRVASVFYNLSGTVTTPELQAVERQLSPKMAAHMSAISLNAQLFARVDDLYQRGNELALDDEQMRVLERHHRNFLRAGAKLSADDKKRMAAISQQLAELSTSFGQNVLADEAGYQLVLDGPDDLAGLPDAAVAAAKAAAEERGLPGKYVITLARSSIEGFITFSDRRDLREEAFNAWIKRGRMGGKTDNLAQIAETVALRAERAKLLGFDSYAAFSLDDTMAKTPQAVRDLLDAVWQRARAQALVERDDLAELARARGDNVELQPWDWRYYAEKLRKARYDLDESEVKPYLQLDQMIAAAFDSAQRLFGLTFKERKDLPAYHPDVRVWEVHYDDGRAPALFMGDYFARSSKRSGAWMSALRRQEKLRGDIRPIIVNVMNFAKPAAGEPALLSFDDARTLFHEFGHALHGLLSDVTYSSISGTAVSRDFVELPSQLYEHWLSQPQVLEQFARHAKTGAPMPADLLKRLKQAENFNMGFATVEYTSSALLDIELHGMVLSKDGKLDIAAFEREALERIGMPREIVMRHRLSHFQHLFSGGYASGYYSYMWSEVMDADAFGAFEEAGDIFDPQTAARLKEHIYSAGNRRDPEDAYVAFRGRRPSIDALLKGRGLIDAG